MTVVGATRRVSSSEADLLMLARALVSRAPGALVANWCQLGPPQAAGVSRDALELLKQTLSTGFVSRLATGGWKRESFLRDGQVVTGRLWERSPDAIRDVRFTQTSLDFLLWLRAGAPAESLLQWDGRRENGLRVEIGDAWLVWEAYRSLRETRIGLSLRQAEAVQNHVILRLAFPADAWTREVEMAAWDSWAASERCWFLEAVQDELVRCTLRWNQQLVDAARGLRSAEHLMVATTLAQAIERFAALERRDLLRFCLNTLAVLGETGPAGPAEAAGPAGAAGSRRAEARAAVTGHAAAGQAVDRVSPPLMDVLFELREQAERCRQVAYYDAEYAAAQLWMQDWERCDGEGWCRAVRDAIDGRS